MIERRWLREKETRGNGGALAALAAEAMLTAEAALAAAS